MQTSNSLNTDQNTTENLKRLARSIRRTGQTFALFFAECNVPELRRKLAEQLNEQLETPAVSVDISSFGDLTEQMPLDQVIALQLENEPDTAPVFLFGLEHMLPTLSKEKVRSTVQQLNWRRGAFGRLQRPLVIWLPSYAMELLAEHTPDLYDWHSGTFDFPADAASLQLAETTTFHQLNQNPDVNSADHMTATEKKRWLVTLKSLLDSHHQEDRDKANLLMRIGRISNSLGDSTIASDCYDDVLSIRRKIGDKLGEGTTLNNIATIAYTQGNYENALKHLKKALAIQKEIGDKSGEGTTLNNISRIYYARGDYETALKQLQKSLQITQEIGDKSGEGTTLNNISQIYDAQGDHETALQYLRQSLSIKQEVGDTVGEGTTLNNISQIYDAQGDRETALKLLEKSLNIFKKTGNTQLLAGTFNNIAQIYSSNGDYETAFRYLNKALGIQKEMDDIEGLCITHLNLGRNHWIKSQRRMAALHFISAYKLASSTQHAYALSTLKQNADYLGIKNTLEDWETLAEQLEDEA